MITISATDFSRNLSSILNRLEYDHEEIAILRNKHTIGKLVPGVPEMSTMDVFSDLYGTLSEEEGGAWIDDSNDFDGIVLNEMRDPWE